MSVSNAAPLLAATHVQCIADKCGNDQLAFVLTGLSVVLVAKMVWDQFTHVDRERLRDVDRKYDLREQRAHGR